MQTKDRFKLLDYCQYLISSQINYTITNLAEHLQKWSHDVINRYLKNEKITARMIWDNVSSHIELDEEAFLLFDDSVLDKNYSYNIEIVKYQYSGNAHDVIKGIGIVNCVYVNPKSGKFWVIDYRIYNPTSDGKTKIEHVKDMLTNAVHHKNIPFKTVLMDKWYASAGMMMFIDSTVKKIFYCPVKKDRRVDDTGGVEKYKRVDELEWSEYEMKHGKVVKLKRLPAEKKVRLFRVIVNHEAEMIATNELSQDSSEVAQEACKVRWKIEEFHREMKQITGIEKCQCRKARIQRNHIGAAMLVWVRLKQLAYDSGKTIYQIKKEQLYDYLVNQLKNPSVQMALA
jgi:hypothetical protein